MLQGASGNGRHGSVDEKRAAPVHARRPAGQGAGVRLQVVAEDEEVTRMVTEVMPLLLISLIGLISPIGHITIPPPYHP